jgi:hypothetical protein
VVLTPLIKKFWVFGLKFHANFLNLYVKSSVYLNIGDGKLPGSSIDTTEHRLARCNILVVQV